ncbi:MAG: LytTR family DNA-binding domain-containing protein, partial [Myxococcota bacterium]
PLGVVYWNILRISAVVSPVVMGGLWLADRPGRLAASAKVPPSAEPMRLQARDASGMRWFDVSDITRLYATDKYVAFRMEGREYLLDESLTALAERLAAAGFLRTHRSELVNRRHVQAFEGSTLVLSDGQQARVSRRAAARVRRALSDR